MSLSIGMAECWTAAAEDARLTGLGASVLAGYSEPGLG